MEQHKEYEYSGSWYLLGSGLREIGLVSVHTTISIFDEKTTKSYFYKRGIIEGIVDTEGPILSKEDSKLTVIVRANFKEQLDEISSKLEEKLNLRLHKKCQLNQYARTQRLLRKLKMYRPKEEE